MFQDIAKKIIKLNEIKERRQKEDEFRLQDEKLHTLGKIKAKVESGGRKIPMRVKLRREAASQSYSNSENDKPNLSLIIKGWLIFHSFFIELSSLEETPIVAR